MLSFLRWWCCWWVLMVPSLALAHPQLEDALALGVSRTGLELEVRSTLRPVIVAADATPRAGHSFSLEEIAILIRDHAPYLAAHLRVRAGAGPLLVPSIVSAAPVEVLTTPIEHSIDLERYHARFVLHYPTQRTVTRVSLEQDMLADAPADRSWRLSYIVVAREAGSERLLGTGLLTRERGFDLDLPERADSGLSSGFWGYFWAGMRHIVSGWDHLLFVCALVLGARRLRELVLVLLSFTLAHSLTLTLAVLGWVHVSSALVESLIAVSIICVSLDNLRRRAGSRGAFRLLVAFGFGLIHGLAFAGPLCAALHAETARALTVGILGFGLGVELGQQLVVLPLFACVSRLSRAQSPRSWPRSLRFASLATASGGAFFLVQALRTFVFA